MKGPSIVSFGSLSLNKKTEYNLVIIMNWRSKGFPLKGKSLRWINSNHIYWECFRKNE